MSCPFFDQCPIFKKKGNEDFICEKNIKNPFYIYIVKCLDGTYYTGYTKNIIRRMKEHRSGNGSKWCTVHGFGKYTYVKCSFSNDARKIERKIKKWSREKKAMLFDQHGTYF